MSRPVSVLVAILLLYPVLNWAFGEAADILGTFLAESNIICQ